MGKVLKTTYEEIVDVSKIGTPEITIPRAEIFAKAEKERLTSAARASKSVLLVCIDMQQDFMDNGSLGVPGAIGDVERLTRFIYTNMDDITSIAFSLDTHFPQQIFHPYWWRDKDGNQAPPFTVITLQDIDNGTWKPMRWPLESREYVEGLHKASKKDLVIWPYHCIQGTSGHSLENQLAAMIYFHSISKRSVPRVLNKGYDPLSEMYGIIKPEFDRKNYYDLKFLDFISQFEMVLIAGEAKSHCVMESIKQILEHFYNSPDKNRMLKKIYILEDCMSVIPGFEESTAKAFDEFRNHYQVNLVKSTDSLF